MKKFILLLPILVLITTFPVASDAAFIIHLDTGAEFVTPWYAQEGNQIRFYIMGGFVGIEKRYVRKIEKSSIVSTGGVAPEGPPSPPGAPARPEPAAAVKPLTTGTLPKGGSNEDQRFVKEFSLLQERFQRVDNMPTEELYAFIKDLRAFRDKVLASRLGHIYDEHLLEISVMGNKAADVLKERGQ